MEIKKTTFQTLCVSEGKDNKTTQPHQLPLYATSAFKMESTDDAIDIFTGQKKGHVYSRYGNPTIDVVAKKIANLEAFGLGLEPYALLTSSGMSAIATLLFGLTESGDTILTQGNLYGGTTELFNKVLASKGIKTTYLNFDDTEAVRKKLAEDKSIKVIYLESPANPTMACIDLEIISGLAKEYNVLTVIDNTFCTPYLQQPFAYGIDFVIHSTTKYLNGHGNSISGIIIGHRKEYENKVWQTHKLIGGVCNAWDAWLLNNGLKTLTLRMDKHCENAMFIANSINANAGINKVNYNALLDNPYHDIASKQMDQFGGMLSFEVATDLAGTKRFIDNLKLCTHAPTLGDTDTLVLHPATSSHINVDKRLCEEYGITDNLVRMSVGIENKADILADIEQALNKL